jgi:hypothetical protein
MLLHCSWQARTSVAQPSRHRPQVSVQLIAEAAQMQINALIYISLAARPPGLWKQ